MRTFPILRTSALTLHICHCLLRSQTYSGWLRLDGDAGWMLSHAVLLLSKGVGGEGFIHMAYEHVNVLEHRNFQMFFLQNLSSLHLGWLQWTFPRRIAADNKYNATAMSCAERENPKLRRFEP